MPYAINGSAHWVFCIEVGEHIPKHKTTSFLKNVLHPACVGVVLSWASDCRGGVGHVNCMNTTEVESTLLPRGFVLDAHATALAREASDFSYLQSSLMVFRRQGGSDAAGRRCRREA